MRRAISAAPEARVEEIDIICERLVATAIEATMIVVESKLHGDPIPSLRGHHQVILEEREKLYRCYHDVDRTSLDALLREHGLYALEREYRADTRNGQTELQRTFLELLFYAPQRDAIAFLHAAELPDISALL
jgi:hypothetical protein